MLFAEFYLNGLKPVYQLGVNHHFGHRTHTLRLCARWFFTEAQRVAETIINAITLKAKPHSGSVFSIDERFKDLSFDPPLRLLVNDMPGWQIVRHQAPRGTTTNDPAQAIEDLAQWKIALRSIFGH